MMLDRVYRAHSWNMVVMVEGSFLLGRQGIATGFHNVSMGIHLGMRMPSQPRLATIWDE